MPRPNRIFVEGGIYRVYNRLGRGERVFDEEMEAMVFVSLLRGGMAGLHLSGILIGQALKETKFLTLTRHS